MALMAVLTSSLLCILVMITIDVTLVNGSTTSESDSADSLPSAVSSPSSASSSSSLPSSSSSSLPLLAFPFPEGDECESDAELLCSSVLRACRGVSGCTLQCLTDHAPKISGACLAAHPCFPDLDRYCMHTSPGQNKMMACLKKHASSLSSDCIAQHPCLSPTADDCKPLDYTDATHASSPTTDIISSNNDPFNDMRTLMNDLTALKEHAVAQGKALAAGRSVEEEEKEAQLADERERDEAEEKEDERNTVSVGVVKLKHHTSTTSSDSVTSSTKDHVHSINLQKKSGHTSTTTTNITNGVTNGTNNTVSSSNGSIASALVLDDVSNNSSSLSSDDTSNSNDNDEWPRRSRQIGQMAEHHDTANEDDNDAAAYNDDDDTDDDDMMNDGHRVVASYTVAITIAAIMIAIVAQQVSHR